MQGFSFLFTFNGLYMSIPLGLLKDEILLLLLCGAASEWWGQALFCKVMLRIFQTSFDDGYLYRQ
jgi:hypothetical protein